MIPALVVMAVAVVAAIPVANAMFPVPGPTLRSASSRTNPSAARPTSTPTPERTPEEKAVLDKAHPDWEESRPMEPGDAHTYHSQAMADIFAEETGWTDIGDGYRWRDMVVGTGPELEPGTAPYMYIKVWLPDGTELQNSLRERLKIHYIHRDGRFPAGIEQALDGMRVGGKRVVVFPGDVPWESTAYLLYKEVPPNTPLMFEFILTRINPDPYAPIQRFQ
jgi:FKBP-type peptidyl-prolyl cis-trans isomerase